MDPHRLQRVTEALREELAEIVGYELEDPRISGAVVTDVQISPDLRRADVRVHPPEGNNDPAGMLRALEGAKGFLKRQLASRLEIYRIPDLRFSIDAVADERLKSLLKRIRKGRPRPEESGGARDTEKNPT